VEKRPDKVPILSDLRESGSIEQDADMVGFIFRPEYYKITEDAEGNDLRGIGQIIIAKHRNGPTGVANLRFKGEFAKFVDVDSRYDESSSEPSTMTYQSKINHEPPNFEAPPF
jgi:replicative DNA helicase